MNSDENEDVDLTEEQQEQEESDEDELFGSWPSIHPTSFTEHIGTAGLVTVQSRYPTVVVYKTNAPDKQTISVKPHTLLLQQIWKHSKDGKNGKGGKRGIPARTTIPVLGRASSSSVSRTQRAVRVLGPPAPAAKRTKHEHRRAST